MIPQVRKRGGLWVTGHGHFVQSHASFREAAESLGAVRRFRQQVKNREDNQGSVPKNSVTVTNRCGYNECRKLSSDESQLGLWNATTTWRKITCSHRIGLHRDHRRKDSIMREAFHYADHRAPKSAAVETDRLLPAGVRSYFREVKAGEDLSHLPLVILDWLFKYELVRKSESTKNRGALILSPLGQQVRNINQRRMEGKND